MSPLLVANARVVFSLTFEPLKTHMTLLGIKLEVESRRPFPSTKTARFPLPGTALAGRRGPVSALTQPSPVDAPLEARGNRRHGVRDAGARDS